MPVRYVKPLPDMPRLVSEDLGEVEEIPPGCHRQNTKAASWGTRHWTSTLLDLPIRVWQSLNDLPLPCDFDCNSEYKSPTSPNALFSGGDLMYVT